MDVIIRRFDPKIDSGFLYGTFTRALHYGRPERYEDSHFEFTREADKKLKHYVLYGKIYIAATKAGEELLLGYSIIDGSTLEFVYVKPQYRKQRIATVLTTNKGIEKYNHENMTKVGGYIIREHKGMFNGKEQEDNGRQHTTNTLIGSAIR